MAKNKNDLDITVLIPTYNRAEGLRETLEAMCRVDRGGLAVEFVLIDNNSTDHTKQIVELFVGQLPIRYRFEPRPGKSCAINGVLNEESLGNVVLFADDDVTPEVGWLQGVANACREWPKHKVFGGKVLSRWPGGQPPSWWALASQKGRWTLGCHDCGDKIQPYPSDHQPMGANMWVRREVLDWPRRFDESVGPRGGRTKIMGQDAVFQRELCRDGYESVYCPDAVVFHRIQLETATPRGLRQRVWSQGRGGAYFGDGCRPSLLIRHPVLWWHLRMGALCFAVVRYLWAMIHWSLGKRLGNSLPALCDIAHNLECLRASGKLRRHFMGVNKS